MDFIIFNFGLLNNYILTKPLSIHIIESINELHALQRKHDELIGKRLQVLIEIKKNEKHGGISKRDLSNLTDINHNSIVKWKFSKL